MDHVEVAGHDRHPPWVTYLLVAANAVVFVVPPTIAVVVFRTGGWLHLLGTILFLLVFGGKVEDRFGRVRFLVFYLLCGYLAAYASAVLTRTESEALVGASGAVSGVLGAYLALFPRARAGSLTRALALLPPRLPAWLAFIPWFAFQWFVGYAAQAVLGFVVGAFAALPLLRRRPRYSYPSRRRTRRAIPH